MSTIQKAKIWEDGLRTDPTKKSFEWWYFDANFSDGTTVVVTFFTKSPSHPQGPVKPEVQIVVNTKDGKKLTFNKYYSPDEFSASKEKCNVIMGPNTVTGNLETYNLHIEMPEFSGDFTFNRIADSYSTRPKHPKGVEYFGWFCAIPYGTVQAELTIKGEKKSYKGTGYHDHNWGIVNLQSVCDYWYWGRGQAGDYSLIFTVMVLPEILGGKHASMLYVAKGKDIVLEDANNLKLTYTDINPSRPKIGHLPTKLTFLYEQGDSHVEFTLNNPELIEKQNPLQKEHGIKGFFSRIFSHPLYVRYNADMDFTITTKGKKDEQKGKSLYEIMILH